MHRTRSVILTILTVSLLAVTVSAQKTTKLLTFDDLASYKAENQTFRIFGYVIDISKCPPCPPRMMCKPCMPNNITIVKKIDPNHLSAPIRLRILTDETDKFTEGEKYLFTVKVHGGVKEGKPITDVDLVRFETLPLGDPLF